MPADHSHQYVNDAIAGRRAIGTGLANALGLERILVFVPKPAGTATPSDPDRALREPVND